MNSRKRRVVLSVAVAACLTLATSCSRREAPSVKLTGVDFDGISTEGIEFTLLADVTNLNDFGASIGRVEYDVLIDGSEIAQGVRTEDVHVPAGEAVEVGIPFTLTWEGAKKGLREFLDGEEHEWKLKGSATIKKGALSKTFRFAEVGRFRGPSEKDVDLDF
jgi:LEA14-like dessication related protein